MIADLDEDSRRETAAEHRRDDRGVRRRPDEGRRAARRSSHATVDAFGKLDIVVNNAGYTWDGIAHKMGDDQFRAMLEIHTVVPFRILRAAAPHFREPAKQEAAEGTRGLPQGRQRHLDLGHAGQRRPGELLGRQGRAGRADEDPRARVGPVQGQRQRRRVRVRRDAADGGRREERVVHDRTTSRSRSGSPSRCGSWRRRSSRSAGPRRPRRPRGRSSSSARPGRTSSRARSSPRAAAR